ncbi:MAG: hypothetical protein RIQ60_2412 [Pseudomonadota bacterium]
MSWFPVLTTTGLFALALWLFRQLIATRLAKSIEHEFNTKIESLRTELRASEERLKAQLREKENDIAALRSGALSVLASRQAALDKRRLEAVDQLWAAYSALAPARAIAAYMSVVKFESAAKLIERDPKARQLFEFFGTGFDAKSMNHGDAAKARPHVTPMVWAVFTAIQAIIAHSVMRWHVLKGGLGSNDFVDHKAIEKLVLVVIPHCAEYLQKNDPSSNYYVLEALDARFLTEIQSMLAGAETDRASVEQAADIVRQAQAIIAATESEKGAI